jgi:hypothetical protein
MRYTDSYSILILLFLVFISCQSTCLPDAKILQVFYKKEWEKVDQKAIPALNLPIREARKLELWLRPHTEYIIRIFAKDSRLLKEMPFWMP